jgi:DNA-binding response OmpR family regulator
MVTVLVAEDDRTEREVIAFRLAAAGFGVRAYRTGASVLAAATADVDLVVLEQRLPGVNGLQLCRRLRNPATADLPVLMVSDTATEDETLAAFAAGADDWIAEPAGLAQLRTRVTALLGRRRRHAGHYHAADRPSR